MSADAHLAANYNQPPATQEAGSTTIAVSLLVSDTEGRWLIAEDPGSPIWRLPGGIVTADDESIVAVAAAALADQTGLQLLVGSLLAACWIEDAGCLVLIFNSFVLGSAVAECEDHTWQMVSPRVARSRLHPRISQVLTGIPAGGPIRYGEHALLVSQPRPEPATALGADKIDTAARVLSMAQQVADQTTTGARQEAEEMLTLAHREADETLGRVRREADDILGKARRQAEKILNDARAQITDDPPGNVASHE